MAVPALLRLEDDSALMLKRRCGNEYSWWNGRAAPRFHFGTPRSVSPKVRQHCPSHCEAHYGKHSNGSAVPALFALARDEWKSKENSDSDHRRDQDEGRLHAWRQIGEDGVEPQEKEIRLRSRLDDGGIRLSAGPIRSEPNRAHGHREHNHPGKEKIFPERIRHKWYAIFFGEVVILLNVS